MLKGNKKFIVAASLVILLQTSSHLYADIEWNSASLVTRDDDSRSKTPVMKDRTKLIEEMAVFAQASYNLTSEVEKKMSPLRKQTNLWTRKELEKTHQMVEFNATIPEGWLLGGRGTVAAGLVGYKDDGISKPELTIAFHGSECVEDFTMANLLLHNRTGKELNLDGNVHGGFHDRYVQGRAGMMNAIMQLLAQNGKNIEDVDIRVTGHSLSGALATIAAADLKKNIAPEGRLHLVTFSSPMVMCPVATEALEKMLGSGRILRVARDNDPVALAPLGLLGYKHVGEEIILETDSNIGLHNHSMDRIVADALKKASAKLVKFEDLSSKFTRKVKSAVKSASSAVSGYLKNTMNKITSWFSR